MAYKHRCYQEFILDTFSAVTKKLSSATRLLELQISQWVHTLVMRVLWDLLFYSEVFKKLEMKWSNSRQHMPVNVAFSRDGITQNHVLKFFVFKSKTWLATSLFCSHKENKREKQIYEFSYNDLRLHACINFPPQWFCYFVS
jgi:hypothetical protein